MLDNVKTNFVETDGFEKSPKKVDYGPMPHKGTVDRNSLEDQIKYLKSSHFELGKDKSQFKHRSRDWVGQNLDSRNKQDPVVWAS